jgi:hypothetical protein
MKEFSQIYTKEMGIGVLRVFVKQNNFIAGEIHVDEKIFYSIPRSSKNLFYLFHGAEGGLGLNEELLLRTDYDLIKVKYLSNILTTTRLKWLNQGIISPFCNSIVDKQIILKISEINLNQAEKYHIEKEPTLFDEVLL